MFSGKPFDESIDLPDTEDVMTPRGVKTDFDVAQESEDELDPHEERLYSDLVHNKFKSHDPNNISDDEYVDWENAELQFDREKAILNMKKENTTSSNYPEEIENLFEFISKYSPQVIEIDTLLKPFISEYIPSVGDIDAFIKIPRPDGKEDNLGLNVLDEPCANQSDPTVMDLKLRALSKEATSKDALVNVRSIKNAEKDTKAIDKWVKSISDLHKSKPAPNLHYTKNMPDVTSLMSEWTPEFEAIINQIKLNISDMECEISKLVDLACALFDIPVYDNRIESLHLLFTLYMEFCSSQHFQQASI